MSKLTDVELMLKVKTGNRSAFEQLVSRHERSLINFFYRQLWDRHRAEDFAQEVFIRIYRSAPNYTPQAKFTTFLFRVAKNLLIDHRRAESVRPNEISVDAAIGGATSDDGQRLLDTLPGRSQKPARPLESTELRSVIMTALDQLPPDQRDVFLLAEFEEMKYQDIADVLGIPLGTVKSRMHAATLRLKDLLIAEAPIARDADDAADAKARAAGSASGTRRAVSGRPPSAAHSGSLRPRSPVQKPRGPRPLPPRPPSEPPVSPEAGTGFESDGVLATPSKIDRDTA